MPWRAAYRNSDVAANMNDPGHRLLKGVDGIRKEQHRATTQVTEQADIHCTKVYSRKRYAESKDPRRQTEMATLLTHLTACLVPKVRSMNYA